MRGKKFAKAVRVPEKKALALMPDDERLLIEALCERINLLPSVTFKDGVPIPPKGKPDALAFAAIMEICKTADVNGALLIVKNAAAGIGFQDKDLGRSVALLQIAELKPKTPLEAMLISQMVAVNTTIGRIIESAMFEGQTLSGKEININLATKLHRTFIQQIEALQKLRGKGQQTVRVEHVTVNSGGQAIVGSIEHKPGGRGKQ